MYEKALKDFSSLSDESAVLERELQSLADELVFLESDKWRAEESKYETIKGEGVDRIVSLETLKKELVDTVGQTYEPEGKTKDERAANLVRFVRSEYAEYDEYENRIQLAERTIRGVKSDITSKERQFTAVQKRLWSVQTKIEGLNKLFGYFTAQADAKNTQRFDERFSVIEHRITEEIISLKSVIETNSGAIDAQKTVLKNMVAAL